MTAGTGRPGGPTRSADDARTKRGHAPRRAPFRETPPRSREQNRNGPWPCYWLERTGTGAVGLRRYSQGAHVGWTCDDGWHEALAWLGETVPYDLGPCHDDGCGHGHVSYPLAEDVYPAPAARSRLWPRECDRGCGYRFAAGDARQVVVEESWRAADGRLMTTHWSRTPPGHEPAGPGAMWDSPWMVWRLNPGRPDDGLTCLTVRCPDRSWRTSGQDWHVDSAASGGGFWTRTGDPRRPLTLSVSPSIAIGVPTDPSYYHGFLRQGALTPHVG